MTTTKLGYRREGMWQYLPKGMSIAELGVWRGDFACRIRCNASPSKLYLVDFWQDDLVGAEMSNPSQEQNWLSIVNKYKEDTIVEVRRMDVRTFLSEPEKIDCVYIDSNHSYPHTRDELNLCLNKVTRFITGHDYVDVPGMGVIQAVNEFVAKHNLPLFITSETDELYPSFIIPLEEWKG